MQPLISSKDLNLIIKAIGTRIDWLKSEHGRHQTMIVDPVLSSFQTLNIVVENRIHEELEALEELQTRLLVNPPTVIPAREFTA